jgi:2'-5' RNA ligase
MMRLFVALELPQALRQRLSVLAAGIPGARWVPPENMHVTIRFIGEVDGARMEEIHAALAEIAAPAFDITLSGVGHFESGRQARALWVGVEKTPELMHLRDKVESAVVRAGLPPEGRKFSPHVTLARLKDATAGRISAFLAANNLFRAEPAPIDSFTLFSSFLGRSGAIYRPEAVYGLDPR